MKEKSFSEVKNTVEENCKELNYVQIPVVTYMLEKEMTERKESRLHKIICALVTALFLTAVLVPAGFLLYMNQYEWSDVSYTQEIETGDEGTAEIYDGITSIRG